MHKILLPLDFQNVSLRVVQQAVVLARHFHSEILLLHVVTPLSYPVGLIEGGTRSPRGICTRTLSSWLRRVWKRRCV